MACNQHCNGSLGAVRDWNLFPSFNIIDALTKGSLTGRI